MSKAMSRGSRCPAAAARRSRRVCAQTGVEGHVPEANPVVFWDLYGKSGHPVRTTISELGPTLLGRILELSDPQLGALEIAFTLADDRGLLLLDLDDLRALLTFVAENRKDISAKYGLVSAQSVAAIQRGLLSLEREGGEAMFGEPALELTDLLRTDLGGRGIINVLAADQLVLKPRLFSSFLLWLLSELFENLPEVGDLDKPKLVFMFDEAHLLFEDAPAALRERVEQVVRIIRSKGVGVYFCSQFPDDVPGEILGQLGNRVQHALRAFTPRDQKAVRTAAETFVPNPRLDVAQVISTLAVGEALVSTLQEGGVPMPVQRTMMAPPRSRIGAITTEERAVVRARSPIGAKYDTAVNRESAYEMLSARCDGCNRCGRRDGCGDVTAPVESRRVSLGDEAAAGYGRDDGQADGTDGGEPARQTDSARHARRDSRIEALAMKQILVYGDSLSWGIVPGTRRRLLFAQRWPGILETELVRGGLVGARDRGLPERPQNRLGRSVQARTQRPDGHRAAHRSQFAARARHPHARHERFSIGASAQRVALGAGHRVAGARDTPGSDRAGHAGAANSHHRAASNRQRLPGRWRRSSPTHAGNPQVSSPAFAAIAAEMSCAFFDAGRVISVSNVDGVHLDADQHEILGRASRRSGQEALMSYDELETDRLKLRMWRESDLDDYAELTADPLVMRFLYAGQAVHARRGVAQHGVLHGALADARDTAIGLSRKKRAAA